MEIRQVLRGGNTGFAQTRPSRKAESKGAGRASVDRLELSRQWVQNLEEQRLQAETARYEKAGKEKKSGGILDMLDGSSAEEQELDALTKQLDVQQKCLKIAMSIMRGKKVPPEDERYLMENDPEGYKLAIAMRGIVKEDGEECESVLEEEDKGGGETSQSEEAAPAETASDGGGEIAE